MRVISHLVVAMLGTRMALPCLAQAEAAQPAASAASAPGTSAALLAKAKPAELDKVIEAATVDMPISTSSASFLLGASGENVPRLTSFRTFAAQIGQAVDAKGKVVNAVAVEIAPALAAHTITWDDLIGESGQAKLRAIWARTTMSVATKVKSADQAAKSAIGFQSILYMPSVKQAVLTEAKDPCQKARKLVSEVPPLPEPTAAPEDPKIQAAIEAAIEACVNGPDGIQGILTKWNQPMVAIGGGRVMVSTEPGAVSSGEHNTTSVWLTAAYGGDFGSNSKNAIKQNGYLVTGHLRQTTSVQTKSTTGTEVLADQTLYGMNGRWGNANLAGMLEYSVLHSRASGAAFANRKRTLIGLEYKVQKDIYLTLGTARDTGADAATQAVIAQLHWGFSNEPVLIR